MSDALPSKNPLKRLFLIEPGEGRLLALAAVFHFLVLGMNSLVTPVRDAMAIEAGVERLPELIWLTLGAMIVINPLFGLLLDRMGRRRLAIAAFQFGVVCLLGAFAAFLLLVAREHPLLTTTFYVWVTVFNLFFVSLFWSVMADSFVESQARRLYAAVGAAGTIGAIAGAELTRRFAESIGFQSSLLVAAIALQMCVLIVMRLTRVAPATPRIESAVKKKSSFTAALAGFRAVVRSPYLVGICLFLFLYTFTSQFLKLESSNIVAHDISDTGARVAFFASVKTWVNIVALSIQLFLTGRLMHWIGVRGALVVVPAVTCIGFAVLGLVPTLGVVAVFEVVRSGLNYAVARPSREVLWTAVPRDEKYVAKNFIDTFIYRGGDALAAGGFKSMQSALSLSLAAIAWVAIVPALAWVAVALAVGAGHRRRAAAKGA